MKFVYFLSLPRSFPASIPASGTVESESGVEEKWTADGGGGRLALGREAVGGTGRSSRPRRDSDSRKRLREYSLLSAQPLESDGGRLPTHAISTHAREIRRRSDARLSSSRHRNRLRRSRALIRRDGGTQAHENEVARRRRRLRRCMPRGVHICRS